MMGRLQSMWISGGQSSHNKVSWEGPLDTILSNPNFKQGQLKSGCLGCCPVNFRITPRIETSQPLQAHVRLPSWWKHFFVLCNQNFPCCNLYPLISSFHCSASRRICISTKFKCSNLLQVWPSNNARSAEDKWSLLLNLKELYCFISVENLALPMSIVRQCIDSCISKHLQMLTYLAAWYFQTWFQQSANLQITFTEHKSTLEYPQLLHRK